MWSRGVVTITGMDRKLRVAVSMIFGLSTLALVAMWVRSFRANELVSRISPAGRLVTLGTNRGCAYLATMKHQLTAPVVVYPSIGLTTGSPYGFQLRKPGQLQARTWPSTGFVWQSHGWRYHRSEAAKSGAAFRLQLGQGTKLVQLPIWSLVLLAMVGGCAPWCTVRFSMQTLLVGMTAVAIAVLLVSRLGS